MPMVERYIWRFIYEDGWEVEEYPDPDTHTPLSAVDMDRVTHLVISPNHMLGATGPDIVVFINRNLRMRPIVYRTVVIDVLGNQEPHRFTVFGTQRTVKGKNVKNLIYIDERTGSMTVTDRPLQIGP